VQRGYQKDIVEANRNALKSEAGAQLARLQLKKDEHIRLCAMRCDKYNDYVKVVPCPARPPRRRSEGLRRGVRDQIRVRLHVYKVKAADLPNIGSDNFEVAMARLMAELRAVVARALPRDPPPPVPYPSRSAHPAPTHAAVAFHVKHLEAINQRGTGGARGAHGGGAVQGPTTPDCSPQVAGLGGSVEGQAKAKGTKRPRAPTAAQGSLESEVFEQDGVDWKVLAVMV